MSFNTVGSLLLENLRDNPDREALVFQDQRLTYRQLAEKVDRLAEALQRLGIGRGDMVALDLPNWLEYVYSLFAITRLGAVAVLINVRYREHEVRHILKDSRAVVAIVPAEFDGFDYPAMLREIREDLPCLRHVIVVGAKEKPESRDVVNMAALMAASNGMLVPEAPITPSEDLALLMYTSGTTGAPKGAMITHANLVRTSEVNCVPYEYTAADVFVVLVPASHIIGLFCLCSVFLYHARAILVDVFKAEPVLQLIERERVTVQHAVPTVLALELANAEKYDISSLRTGLVAGATVPADLARRWLERGFQLHIGYGMTETAGGVCNTWFSDDLKARTETAGKPVEGTRLKFVDDERRELPRGQVGEIALQSYGLMKGYYRQPEATRAATDAEGWFYTGDLGLIDERGYVRIVGRKKDMIIRGGYNIYPSELEGLLVTHPKVLEVAVIGVPDKVMGEKTCACIRPQPDVEISEAEFKDYCRGKIADYKVPDYVRFVESMPLTPTGKVYKVGLKESILKSFEQ